MRSRKRLKLQQDTILSSDKEVVRKKKQEHVTRFLNGFRYGF